MPFQLERRSSPLSTLLLVTDEEGNVRALEYLAYEARMHRLLKIHYGEYELKEGSIPKSVSEAIDHYFDGKLDALDSLATATGGTAFQKDVWKALRTIPAGRTISYGQLAAQLGRSGASRAVGAANGANPISIIVPCHRVIGANGSMTGYASGVPNKQWLLAHEAKFSAVPTLA